MSDGKYKPLSDDELLDAIAAGDLNRIAADARFHRDRAWGWYEYAKQLEERVRQWEAHCVAISKGVA